MLLVKRSATLLCEAKLLVPELLLAMVTLFIFYFITVNLFLSYKAIVYFYFTGKLKFFFANLAVSIIDVASKPKYALL